jgi:hypothetical protein
MPDLRFQVVSARAEPYAAGPLLKFALEVSQSAASGAHVVPIHAITLQCQIRIDPTQRRYVNGEQEKLVDLFDLRARWGQTMRPMLWTHSSIGVGPFTDSITVDLPVPCTYDFNLAVTKYFYALEDGEIPITLLFSGTMFLEGEDGAMQVAQIPWDKEAAFRLPVQVWKEMMELYYPNTAWLCLRRDVFDRLYQFKSRHGIPTWEQALESLLSTQDGGAVVANGTGRSRENSVS